MNLFSTHPSRPTDKQTEKSTGVQTNKKVNREGSNAQWLAYLLHDPAALGSIPTVTPKIISEEKIVNVTEVNQWRCLEESGQWLESVAQTYLLLASGKLILQTK